jgi:hypothetical protein
MNNERGLFDKKALASINSPEQLNQHIKIIRPGYWAVTIGSLALVCGLLYWCFWGNLTDSAKVLGLIFPQSGVTTVAARCDGAALAVLVREGDAVSLGDVIWITQNDALLNEIKALRGTLATAPAGEKESVQRRLDALIFEYEDTSVIKAEASGIVQSVAPKNAAIKKGEPVAVIINGNTFTNDRELVAYVPMSIAAKFKPGMEAQVSPVYAPREEYGFIKGYITSVGSVPITEENILKKFGTPEYTKNLLTEDNMVELRVMLAVDSNSQNLFLWSNVKGNSLVVNTGTICDVLVVFKEFRPIELLYR